MERLTVKLISLCILLLLVSWSLADFLDGLAALVLKGVGLVLVSGVMYLLYWLSKED